MLFSEAFNIEKTKEDDWLDIILDVDTKLWVDPFMIYQEGGGFWSGTHDVVIKHFETCFELIIDGRMQPISLQYSKAVRLLTFKEPREFCLGYTEKGTDGTGGGRGYAKLIARAMVQAVNRGLSDLNHFEELGILEKGIGPDRIGDITCNILKFKFIEYTKQVATRHKLNTKAFRVLNARFDPETKRWQSESHNLPVNPSSGLPILLTPERFIRDIPFLNPEAWFDDYQAEELRMDMNYDVLKNVDKTIIVETARRHAENVRNWTESMEQYADPKPYDLDADPDGVYQWHEAAKEFTYNNPVKLKEPKNDEEFVSFIQTIIANFRNYVEQQSGWKLLWNDDGTEKNEEAVQLLFLGIAKAYCTQNNINLDREVWMGRGPVDFKFSKGYVLRALLEIKKLQSGGFWHGIETQVPIYLQGDECEQAWYVGVQYRPKGESQKRALRLGGIIADLQKNTGKVVRYEQISAIRKPPSASKA
jgi:hypothetical protein